MEWNNLNSASLSLGQKLIIHQKKAKEKEVKKTKEKEIEKHKKYVYHIVQKGDTIFKISKRYQITPTQILEWNNKKDYSLSIGEQLIVKVL